jgi:hypothetical protein
MGTNSIIFSIFVNEDKHLQVMPYPCGLLEGKLLALHSNIRLCGEGPGKDKRSSLLRTLVNYVHKSFITLNTRGQCNKTFLSIIYGFL